MASNYLMMFFSCKHEKAESLHKKQLATMGNKLKFNVTQTALEN